ncbi:MAG: ABC transporter permease [Actinomycetota bacterium]
MTVAALRVTETSIRYYLRTWRGSVISSFAVPLFTLLAMGHGLGRLVDQQGGANGVAYLTFLTPALIAATAMMTAAGESSYPVLAGIKWTKSFHAALATPVGVADLVYGLFGWLGLRLAFNLVIYGAIAAALGAMTWTAAMLSVIPATLTGMAFGTPITAWVASLENDTALSSMFRFGVMPLFLFSGTFFPITQLPDWLEPLAFLSPLWHGVELTRFVAGVPGTPYLLWWIHAGALSLLTAAGTVIAVRNMTKTLRT